MGSIVTLAAAGSETSDSAVLTNEQTGQNVVLVRHLIVHVLLL